MQKFEKETWENFDEKTKEELKKGKLLLEVKTTKKEDGRIEVYISAAGCDGYTSGVFKRTWNGYEYEYEIRKVTEQGIYEEDEEGKTIWYYEKIVNTMEEARNVIKEVIKKIAENRRKVREKEFEEVKDVYLI